MPKGIRDYPKSRPQRVAEHKLEHARRAAQRGHKELAEFFLQRATELGAIPRRQVHRVRRMIHV